MEIKWVVSLVVIVILALALNNKSLPSQSTQPSSCPEFESFQNDFITSIKEIQNTITYPQEAINYQVGVRGASDAIYQTVPSNVFLVKGVPNGTNVIATIGIRNTLGGNYEIRNITPSSIRCNGDYIFYFVGTIKDLVGFEDRSSPYDVLYSVSYVNAGKLIQSSVNILLSCKSTDLWGWMCSDSKYSDLPNMTRQEFDAIKQSHILIGEGRTYSLVCSPSMYPTITCENTYVGIVPSNKYDMKVGDIIFYSHYMDDYQGTPIGYVVHRIYESGTDSDGKYYITKGDHAEFADDWKVRPYQIHFQIIGRYVG